MCKLRYCTPKRCSISLVRESPNTPNRITQNRIRSKKEEHNGKKNSRIYFRCSAKDKENLKNKAKLANMNMSEYIISLSENKKIFVIDGVPELMTAINRIGTNINQVAAVANTQRFVNENQLEKILKEMKNINKIMNLVWKKILKEE